MERPSRLDQLIDLLKSDPDDLFLNYALGIEYVALSDSQKAENQFNKVMALDNNYIAVYYQMGKLFEQESKTLEALNLYKIGLTKAREKKDKSISEFEEAIFMLED
jgi:tetratricopeptide (TPR) repeat protein